MRIDDLYDCGDCLHSAVCDFHAGMAEGWDACVAFMAEAVEVERQAELTLADIERVL